MRKGVAEMSKIEDKIKKAVEAMKSKAGVVCSECEFEYLCQETEDYTGMCFCESTADEIINKLNDGG